MSDSIESSRVLAKASTSSGGRSRINHIVSENSISVPFAYSHSVCTSGAIHIFPTLVPSVAKSLSSESTHLFVRAFRSVDFHAFVYPTIHTVKNPFFFLP